MNTIMLMITIISDTLSQQYTTDVELSTIDWENPNIYVTVKSCD